MPSYSIVKNHVFIGPAFYCTSGTYKWNIVNDETKKTVLTITDVAKIKLNYYTEHEATPEKVKEIVVNENVVSEILKDGTTYLYELDGDVVVNKKIKVPSGWNSLVYELKLKSNKVYSCIFKDGYFADLTEGNRTYIYESDYNSFISEFENSNGVFERYGLEKLYYIQLIYKGYYYVAKYSSSKTEIFYENQFYTNESIDEILKCVSDKRATYEDICKTEQKIKSMITDGTKQTIKHQNAMVKHIHEHFLSLKCQNKCITYSPENGHDIVSVKVIAVNKFNIVHILTLKFADSQAETYFVLGSSPSKISGYTRYTSEIKELIEKINHYIELHEKYQMVFDLTKLINVKSFIQITPSLPTKRHRTAQF
jgi:hypothetical protein